MRPKLRLLLAGWAALGLVPAMLMVAAGPAVSGSAAGSLVRALQAEPGTGTGLPADSLEPDAAQYSSAFFAGWADVAKQNVELRYVTATFKVPSVGSCTSGDQGATFWVGLDGWSTPSTPVQPNTTVEQVGVSVQCVQEQPAGPYYPHYYGFWEIVPNGSHRPTTLGAGDKVTVSVYFNSNTNEYNLVLNDSNRSSADINTSQPCPSGSICHNATAEVIAEDPNGGPAKGFDLADFGTVSFTGAQVTSRDGTQGALQSNSLWNANHIHMEYNGNKMANTSGRTNNYQDFHVDWVPPS